ncbi:hypothetical protein [Noviherbaspirillum pedocola]|uniref:Terminal beta-(1->2)-arabinofuranosyltransferase C-terminal domain-containing protein n=1 Tax=Noviherbaspirillum pedocola TaxID=2801341 RepID=A0A934W617_9BURK|nr:hypothetical protein [Noviherbaspirillum pedocola]MBK4733828.1 hypothetical protein [Noviherbaspirillum pedocola]
MSTKNFQSAASTRSIFSTSRAHLLLLPVLLALFSIAFLRTAWVAEDAFITFRTIDNALHGLGLTWNPGDRVQTYTHPLWLCLLLPIIGLFNDPFYVSLITSYLLLLTTLIILFRTINERSISGLMVIASLLWSRSFIDYSSSGLENPLTHALLAGYVFVWTRDPDFRYRPFLLSGIISALFLTRPDAIVLVTPSFIFYLWSMRRRIKQHFLMVLVGTLPAILWIAFSLFYYGTPVPNTALAKVQTGNSFLHNLIQAYYYHEWALQNDPGTLLLVIAGIILGISGSARLRPIAFGLLLWEAYLSYVGADYMGGRFFSGAVLVATALIAIYVKKQPNQRIVWGIALTLIFTSGILKWTLFSSTHYEQSAFSAGGIADERGFYYRALGLIPSIRRGTWESHIWLQEGKFLRAYTGWYTRCNIGMAGYMAGPNVKWVDPLGLADPLLARLPSRRNARVGHYERAFPAGYLQSLVVNKNLVRDPKIAALEADVGKAVRAPLFSAGRLSAIWRLNTGYHSRAADNFNREAIGLPGIPVKTFSKISCYGLPPAEEATWQLAGSPVTAMRVTFPDFLSGAAPTK